MKKNRVEKICLICTKKFEVIRCRENTARFCSKECYNVGKTGRTPWNKGKTYSEIYDQSESERIRKIQSYHSSGEQNPMYGKHHSKTTKQIMSNKKEGYVPWITGKKIPGLFKHIDRRKENNAYVKYVMRKDGVTYQEYLSRLTDKERYFREVMTVTRMQPIHILESYDKRAKAPGEEAYHLDHIFPISKGFEYQISPHIIGDISNLRFIHWKENLAKKDKVLVEIINKELYESGILDRNTI